MILAAVLEYLLNFPLFTVDERFPVAIEPEPLKSPRHNRLHYQIQG
jgi:hypothetical protein